MIEDHLSKTNLLNIIDCLMQSLIFLKILCLSNMLTSQNMKKDMWIIEKYFSLDYKYWGLKISCLKCYIHFADKKIKKTVTEESGPVRRPSQISISEPRTISGNPSSSTPTVSTNNICTSPIPSTSTSHPPVPANNTQNNRVQPRPVQRPPESRSSPIRAHMIHDPNDTRHLERYGPVVSADPSIPLPKGIEVMKEFFPGPASTNRRPPTPTAPPTPLESPPPYTPVASDHPINHTTRVEVRTEHHPQATQVRANYDQPTQARAENYEPTQVLADRHQSAQVRADQSTQVRADHHQPTRERFDQHQPILQPLHQPVREYL